MKTKLAVIFILTVILAVGCTSKKGPKLDGHWMASWESSGGEIPADMYIKTTENGEIEAEVHNDTEIVKFDRVLKTENHIDFYIDRYECMISADLSEDGMSMTGEWSKQTGTPNQMPFSAIKGDIERFPIEKYNPEPNDALLKDISGAWKVRFEGDKYDSMGLFRQEGDRVTGTIRAIDGDFRFLEGIYRNGLLLLSSFNGTWVFIFRAEMDEQGLMKGYWARGPKPAVNWTATKEEPDYPDTWELTKLSNDDGVLSFSYPTADDSEQVISSSDPRFKGKPFLAAFYLSGCPNCHDSAEILSQLSKEFKGRDFEMAFIFYELTDRIERIKARVKLFLEEHDLPYPGLYSLAMSKKEIVQEIPDFRNFYAWPTVVFYNSEGKVAAIHTGVDGPATGEYHQKLIDQYRTKIEELLSPTE
jgi:thiol-disulfide isomerase/thioredoxin